MMLQIEPIFFAIFLLVGIPTAGDPSHLSDRKPDWPNHEKIYPKTSDYNSQQHWNTSSWDLDEYKGIINPDRVFFCKSLVIKSNVSVVIISNNYLPDRYESHSRNKRRHDETTPGVAEILAETVKEVLHEIADAIGDKISDAIFYCASWFTGFGSFDPWEQEEEEATLPPT